MLAAYLKQCIFKYIYFLKHSEITWTKVVWPYLSKKNYQWNNLSKIFLFLKELPLISGCFSNNQLLNLKKQMRTTKSAKVRFYWTNNEYSSNIMLPNDSSLWSPWHWKVLSSFFTYRVTKVEQPSTTAKAKFSKE